MRLPKKKGTARVTALALAFGVVGVLVTALPAWAATPTVTQVSPTSGVRGHRGDRHRNGFPEHRP